MAAADRPPIEAPEHPEKTEKMINTTTRATLPKSSAVGVPCQKIPYMGAGRYPRRHPPYDHYSLFPRTYVVKDSVSFSVPQATEIFFV